MSQLACENIDNYCRVCLTQLDRQGDMLDRKYNIHEESYLYEWICACTTITTMPNDGYPKFVCQQCYDQLRVFNEFRDMSRRSTRILAALLNENKLSDNAEDFVDIGVMPQLEDDEQEQVLNKIYGNNPWLQYPFPNKGSHLEQEQLLNRLKEMDDKNMVMRSLLQQELIFSDSVESPPPLHMESLSESTNTTKDEKKSESSLESCIIKDNCVGVDTTESSDLTETANSDSIQADTSYDGDTTTDISLHIRHKRIKGKFLPKTKTVSRKKSDTSTASLKMKKSKGTVQRQQHPCCGINHKHLEGHTHTYQGIKPYECAKHKQISSKAHHNHIHPCEAQKKQQEFICPYKVEYENNCKSHFHTNHMNTHCKCMPRSYTCDQCGRTFSNNAKLKEHSYKHAAADQYPYKCDQCNKRFAKKCNYKEHLLGHVDCSQSSMQEAINEFCTLTKHHRKERLDQCNNTITRDMHDPVMYKSMKRYVCAYCAKSFGQWDTWKNHEMQHTGEKPYDCGKRLLQVVALRAHIQAHKKFGNKQASKMA